MSERLGLFEATGIEIEYAIVDRTSLDVRPVCDGLIAAMAGEPASELDRGPIAWSNELALHVLELKTNGPAARLEGLGALFHEEVLTAIDGLEGLEGLGRLGESGGLDGSGGLEESGGLDGAGGLNATLLPGGMHPWMDPMTETRLWPHEYNDVYRTFDRIFGCSGHGWSNLQSTHVNLPFSGDEEFARLHAAIRVVLPLIPALAASSPFLDRTLQPSLDARLEAYAKNAARIPEVTGLVIPDAVSSEQEYRDLILRPMYQALQPHDPAGVLRHEWANARGAIARFERGAIEIRVIDAQECPATDLAIVALVSGVVRALTEERWMAVPRINAIGTQDLAAVFRSAVKLGGDAVVSDLRLLGALGWPRSDATAIQLWRSLADRIAPDHVPDEYGSALETIVGRGTLASRMARSHGCGSSIESIAGRLVDCLVADQPFVD